MVFKAQKRPQGDVEMSQPKAQKTEQGKGKDKGKGKGWGKGKGKGKR